MKILSFTTSYPRSRDDDSSIFVHRLYKALAASGTTIKVAAPVDGISASNEDRDGVKICWFRYVPVGRPKLVYGAGLLPNLRRAPWCVYELPLLILRFVTLGLKFHADTDLIHANWILSGIAAWFLKIITGKPYVITLRGSDAMLFGIAPVRWLSYLPLHAAAAVITVSAQMRTETVAHFPNLKDRCFCIQNGVAATSLEPAPSTLPSLPGKFLLAIGSIIERKRLECAIELIAADPLKSYSLVMCGKTEAPEYLAKLSALAANRGVADRVFFLGPVSPDSIPALLSKAAAFLTCSSYEGRPNALLEALSAGKLVIASDIPAHKEILGDQTTGIIFDPTDPKSAASRIQTILEDDVVVKRIADQGKQLVQNSGWDRCAIEYQQLLERCGVKRLPH